MKLKKSVVLIALLTPLVFSLCKREPEIAINMSNNAAYDDTPYDLDYGRFAEPDMGDNALTIEGVKLGRLLFYETLLSKDNSISCGSCHIQEKGFSDPNRLSEGVDGSLGKRQAMPVFNMLWHTNEFFWDGRAHLLRDQSLMPIQDDLEMKETLENVVAKLNATNTYPAQFLRAFGDEEITAERMSLAMEQFMNSIISNQSKYDKYLDGQASLTDSEERGRILFSAEYNPGFPNLSGADCAHCHGGNNFDNNRYMNNGLDSEPNQTDIGREAVTEDPKDRAAFKVPSLRNIELTAPYMHDGRFTTLEEVVDHYDHGIVISGSVDPALAFSTQTGLQLSDQDKIDLISFLKTLTDEEMIADERFSDPF
ncbi:c-type cytochrome [Salibacteraceae bacterium]|nr:c-type cytochrome [Salibacteraceae bacterium]MDB9709110.1 c-type cytochrome [Salibacteraceae bacterium]HAQ70562.1 cytochrome-c peroxidase [Flavobacteriales bacterium]